MGMVLTTLYLIMMASSMYSCSSAMLDAPLKSQPKWFYECALRFKIPFQFPISNSHFKSHTQPHFDSIAVSQTKIHQRNGSAEVLVQHSDLCVELNGSRESRCTREEKTTPRCLETKHTHTHTHTKVTSLFLVVNGHFRLCADNSMESKNFNDTPLV